MVKDIVKDKPTIKCIKRIYEVSSGNRVTRIASSKVIVGDVLEAILREDYELGKFVENFEILGTSIISVVPIAESLPHIREEKDKEKETEKEKEKDKHPVFAKLPNIKQRHWMILHDMPDDKCFSQLDWQKYLSDKGYDFRQIKNSSATDFKGLVDLGNLQKVDIGKYKIVDKGVYKDNKEFLESMSKLKKGENLVLA